MEENKNNKHEENYFKDELTLEDRILNEKCVLFCLEKGYSKLN